jgi:hypothetical protein
LTPKGAFALGFDFFLLHAQFLRVVLEQQLVPSEYRIGEPWWDYLLPVLALARGFPLKRLFGSHPLALHYVHPPRYSQDTWQHNGELFMGVVARLLKEPDCYATGVLLDVINNNHEASAIPSRLLP